MTARLRRAGPRAWLLEVETAAAARRLHRSLIASPVRGQVAARLGARTVLASFASERAAREAAGLLRDATGTAVPADTPAGGRVTVDVLYDGPDLDPVAAHLGLSREALVAAHTAATWTAAFVGFAPGFAYLDGWELRVPRRESPRTRVPAGAVAVADGWSAVYPSPSPGGWQLVGTTRAALWRTDRVPPALVAPGDQVRFRAVRDTALLADPSPARTVLPVGDGDAVSGHPPSDGGPAAGAPGRPPLQVIAPGPLTIVEDEGRQGMEHVGVPPSGAADRTAARAANRLVGNPRGAALLETLGDLVLSSEGEHVVAVHGAPGGIEVAEPDGTGVLAVSTGEAFRLGPSQLLRVAAPTAGVRRYVAVRGGLDVPTELGSRSTDLLSQLGPAPVRAGQALPVRGGGGLVDHPVPPRALTGTHRVRVVLGPRDDWFTPAAVAALLAGHWTVRAESNRVGLRLAGPRLARSVLDELASEPMVPGAVQVPPAGPVVLLRDHPTTGGYPVVAVVVPQDLDVLGQAAPGDTVRFVRA